MNEQSKTIRRGKTIQIFIMCVILLIEAIFMIGCAEKTTQSAKPDCVVSNTFNDEYTLTIIANRERIDDKEKFAKELIEKVRHNNFRTILFSYDEVGYPTRLEMTVYLNKEDWENHTSVMSVSLRQQNTLDNFNIVENYDKFFLEVK